MQKVQANNESRFTRSNRLFPVSKHRYGPTYNADLLTAYRLYFDSVRYTSQARRAKDNFFLSINTLFLTAFGLIYSDPELLPPNNYWAWLVSVIGVLICINWWAVSYFYRKRNRVKLSIIHQIEESLPVAFYSAEREAMQKRHKWFARRFAWLRFVTPWIFAILYISIPFLF